jgi:hypothetical protein
MTERFQLRYREVVDDGQVTTGAHNAAVVDAVIAFFAEHRGASLRLPSGWFGRPYDNLHQLTEGRTQGEAVLVRLDHKQVLTLDAERASSDEGVLRVGPIRGGNWCWTEYGTDREHREALSSGTVEFHAIVMG